VKKEWNMRKTPKTSWMRTEWLGFLLLLLFYMSQGSGDSYAASPTEAGRTGQDLPAEHEQKTDMPAEKSEKERKILYWRAPMDPMEIYDEPGKSRMGMDLVPVYEDEVSDGAEVRIDPVIQQNMGVRAARVEKGPLHHTIRTYGHVTHDETRTVDISPKFSGWIEDLYVDFTGRAVKRGEPLFSIYSPQLVTAQGEYLEAYRRAGRVQGMIGESLLGAVRQKLLYWDVPEDQIRRIGETGEIARTLIIRSPFAGIVIAKNAVSGTYVREGTAVYTVSDFSRVWVEVHIFEYELPWVRMGQEARMTLPYLPGKAYRGKVSYVYPYLQKTTRDVVIRLEFQNPGLELKPNMYADVEISGMEGEGLMVPSMAVLRSGERNIVFVPRGEGKFTPREITLGLALDEGKVQVLTGLEEGESVVVSGQFLLDSESKLREAVLKMMKPGDVELPARPPVEHTH
jgi:multidrug efflux pump subunit AcrA (membrane-fusion protein)